MIHCLIYYLAAKSADQQSGKGSIRRFLHRRCTWPPYQSSTRQRTTARGRAKKPALLSVGSRTLQMLDDKQFHVPAESMLHTCNWAKKFSGAPGPGTPQPNGGSCWVGEGGSKDDADRLPFACILVWHFQPRDGGFRPVRMSRLRKNLFLGHGFQTPQNNRI